MTVNVDAIETDSISPKTPLGEVTVNELASNSVNITGGTITGVAASFTSGTITGITDLAVADGGTGASTAAGAATNLGLGTGDSPQFTAVNIGHATDSTLTRTAAGRIAIEGLGIVKGPASSTDNAVVRFDSTTGELVQNSAVVIDDSNNISGVALLTTTSNIELGHASDTTLARVSAGVVSIEGKNIGITLGTEQVSTSGTAISFTGIPAGVKRIVMLFEGVSTSGTSLLQVQLGDVTSYEATGYLSNAFGASNSALIGAAPAVHATGFLVASTIAATYTLHGSMTFHLKDATGFTWVAQGAVTNSTATETYFSSGSKSLTSELTRIQLTTVNGSDTFDAGSINIQYEF